MTTLKPCPFCDVPFERNDFSWCVRFVCPQCRTEHRWDTNGIEEGEAVRLLTEMMNHRPGEEAVAEECARIADALAEAPDIELNTIGLSTSDFALYHIRLYARSIARKIRSRFGGKP